VSEIAKGKIIIPARFSPIVGKSRTTDTPACSKMLRSESVFSMAPTIVRYSRPISNAR